MANYLLGLILNQAYHNEPQILVPLLNLIYVKDLSEEITTNATLLIKTNAWANQWKITFNPDPNKQAQEVGFFSRKINET